MEYFHITQSWVEEEVVVSEISSLNLIQLLREEFLRYLSILSWLKL